MFPRAESLMALHWEGSHHVNRRVPRYSEHPPFGQTARSKPCQGSLHGLDGVRFDDSEVNDASRHMPSSDLDEVLVDRDGDGFLCVRVGDDLCVGNLLEVGIVCGPSLVSFRSKHGRNLSRHTMVREESQFGSYPASACSAERAAST